MKLTTKTPAPATDDAPTSPAPADRPRKGALVAFSRIDPITGRRHNGHGIVRERYEDEDGNTRTVVHVLPSDVIACADDELTRI